MYICQYYSSNSSPHHPHAPHPQVHSQRLRLYSCPASEMVVLCEHFVNILCGLVCVEQNFCLLYSTVYRPANLGLTDPYLWIVVEYLVKSKDSWHFCLGPWRRTQRLSLWKGYFVFSFFGRLTMVVYSLGSGAHPFTCSLLVSQQGSIISLLWICDWCPWPGGSPLSPFRKQEG